MALLRAFTALDMSDLLPRSATITASDDIVVEAEDGRTVLSGQVTTGSSGVRGTIIALEQTHDDTPVFQVSGLHHSASALFSILGTGKDADFLSYAFSGADRILGSSGADTLIGARGADTISGGLGADNLLGGNGGDRLAGGWGADHLSGGLGADTLTGGEGRDLLRGGLGADTFDFRTAAEANGDHIVDLAATDRLDLSALDANPARAGDQAFRFLGDSHFTHHAGELATHGDWLSGDLDGDGTADFRLRIDGHDDLSQNNLIL